MQEAQQDTVATFESYMDECMARDWAANKRQLFGLIAPHSGGGIASSLGGGMLASGPLIGAQGQAGGEGLWRVVCMVCCIWCTLYMELGGPCLHRDP
eukprot:1159929-Pelagomonas_calceolata.AAC.11